MIVFVVSQASDENVHPEYVFINEFEAKPQTSLLLGTSGIRAATALPI